MSYLIQEIQSLQNRIRAHERLLVAMALKVDELNAENEDLRETLVEILCQRDEAKELLRDLQREIVPA